MGRAIREFLDDEQGQDLLDHTLLVGVVALVSVGLFLMSGRSVNSIWTSGSTTLTNAASVLRGATGVSGTAGPTGNPTNGCDHDHGCRDDGH